MPQICVPSLSSESPFYRATGEVQGVTLKLSGWGHTERDFVIVKHHHSPGAIWLAWTDTTLFQRPIWAWSRSTRFNVHTHYLVDCLKNLVECWCVIYRIEGLFMLLQWYDQRPNWSIFLKSIRCFGRCNCKHQSLFLWPQEDFSAGDFTKDASLCLLHKKLIEMVQWIFYEFVCDVGCQIKLCYVCEWGVCTTGDHDSDGGCDYWPGTLGTVVPPPELRTFLISWFSFPIIFPEGKIFQTYFSKSHQVKNRWSLQCFRLWETYHENVGVYNAGEWTMWNVFKKFKCRNICQNMFYGLEIHFCEILKRFEFFTFFGDCRHSHFHMDWLSMSTMIVTIFFRPEEIFEIRLDEILKNVSQHQAITHSSAFAQTFFTDVPSGVGSLCWKYQKHSPSQFGYV